MTKPTDDAVLQDFYNRTRPFGFWKRFKNTLPEKEIEKIDKENKRDIVSTFIAVPWQIVLFMFMMNLIFKVWNQFVILLLLLVVLSAGLYFNWFRYLSEKPRIPRRNRMKKGH
jgi:hypothetical protein